MRRCSRKLIEIRRAKQIKKMLRCPHELPTENPSRIVMFSEMRAIIIIIVTPKSKKQKIFYSALYRGTGVVTEWNGLLRA